MSIYLGQRVWSKNNFETGYITYYLFGKAMTCLAHFEFYHLLLLKILKITLSYCSPNNNGTSLAYFWVFIFNWHLIIVKCLPKLFLQSHDKFIMFSLLILSFELTCSQPIPYSLDILRFRAQTMPQINGKRQGVPN